MKQLKDFNYQTKLIPCDFCQSTTMLPFMDKMRHGLNLSTKICSNCGLSQTNPQPTKESINEFYTNYYHLFHQRAGVDENYVAKSRKMAARRIEIIKNVIDPKQSKEILEIGPGAGQFMKLISEQTSWQSEGIELGLDSFNWCKSIGLNVQNVGIEDFRTEKKFDCISSFHVLEHIPTPTIFLMKCSEMIKDNGILYLEVPNFNRPGGIFSNFLQFPHLFNFTAITLSNYLRKYGFAPILIDDALMNLTIVSRKISSHVMSDVFTRTNFDKDTKALKRKDKIYKWIDKIPSIPYIRKIKSLIKSL